MRATLPAVTRAAVYHGSEDIRIETVPLREPGPGEALVRIRACGLCHSETMAWYMRRKAPAGLGHEPVGEVIGAGDGVTLPAGQRVFVHHHAPCLACRACRRGHYSQCETWRETGLIPGALAEHAIVPAEIVARDLLPLPADLSDGAAVFVEPLACVVKAFRRARVQRRDRVAVVGLGVMGLLHVLLARAEGVETVVGLDLRPDRLPGGRAAGADEVIDAGATGASDRVLAATEGGADVVAVTPGSVEALALGLRCLAPAGRLLVFTPLPPEAAWPLPVHDLYFREWEVIPSYSAGPDDTRTALRHLGAGLPVEGLISHRLPLEAAAEGYRLVREGRALKVVVQP